MKEILAADQIGFPVLSALIFLPIVVAIVLQFLRSEAAQRQAVLIGAVLELALALFVTVKFIPGTADIQFAEHSTWMSDLGASFHFGVDGISVLFLPLTALVILMALVFSPPDGRSFGRFYLTCIMVFEAINMGIFVSLDLLSFFVFWELALIPSYFLIKLWGLGPGAAAPVRRHQVRALHAGRLVAAADCDHPAQRQLQRGGSRRSGGCGSGLRLRGFARCGGQA